MARIIKDADEIIDALGGIGAVGKLLGASPQTVFNWRGRGFPAYRYPEVRALLRRERLKFSNDIFARMGRNGGKR